MAGATDEGRGASAIIRAHLSRTKALGDGNEPAPVAFPGYVLRSAWHDHALASGAPWHPIGPPYPCDFPSTAPVSSARHCRYPRPTATIAPKARRLPPLSFIAFSCRRGGFGDPASPRCLST